MRVSRGHHHGAGIGGSQGRDVPGEVRSRRPFTCTGPLSGASPTEFGPWLLEPPVEVIERHCTRTVVGPESGVPASGSPASGGPESGGPESGKPRVRAGIRGRHLDGMLHTALVLADPLRVRSRRSVVSSRQSAAFWHSSPPQPDMGEEEHAGDERSGEQGRAAGTRSPPEVTKAVACIDGTPTHRGGGEPTLVHDDGATSWRPR